MRRLALFLAPICLMAVGSEIAERLLRPVTPAAAAIDPSVELR